MDTCTDTLRLNDKKLFKVIKDSVPKDGKETQNILEIRDDVLYVWNADESCILTLNVGASRGNTGDDVVYQWQTVCFVKLKIAIEHSANILFNALKIYASAVSAGSSDLSLILEVEDCRDQALIELRADIQIKFSLFDAIYIATSLNHTGIVSGLAANQLSQTVAFYNFKDRIGAIFNTIIRYLARIPLKLYDDGDADSPMTDVIEAAAISKTNAGFISTVKPILAIDPNASAAIAAAFEELFHSVDYEITAAFNAIRIARLGRSNTSHATDGIENFTEAEYPQAERTYQIIFDILTNNQTLDAASEAKLTSLKQILAVSTKSYMRNIYDAIAVLANAADATVASASDLDAIQVHKNLTISSAHNFTEALSGAGIIRLLAHNGK